MEYKLSNGSEIGIVGLGYVGLPLSVEFQKHFRVKGFDIDETRVEELLNGIDETSEVCEAKLKGATNLTFHNSISDLCSCNVFIITVPTPILSNKEPDLRPLENACRLVGQILSANDVVIFESTVYPGATEEFCAPILEEVSGLTYANNTLKQPNEIFYLGYSPERINPGDKNHRLIDITKVTSGCTPEAADFIDDLYSKVIAAGTYKAKSIKTAEAAKVIENTQRDLNIALINELSIIFDKMNLDTEAILEAAGTKWNFLPFRPGLVGGHCIGVDPYYLTHKAQQIGYVPDVILAGRRINDDMSRYVANKIVFLMDGKNINIKNSKILVLGLAFKENCPDMRNSKVVDMVNILSSYGAKLDVFDPLVNPNKIPTNMQGNYITKPNLSYYDCVVLAVLHDELVNLGEKKIRAFCKSEHVFFDMKYGFDVSSSDGRI